MICFETVNLTIPGSDGSPQANAQEFGKGAHRPPESGLTKPTLVRRVTALYTPDAMRARITGAVSLDAVIGTDGRVGETRITRSIDATHGLDEIAPEAARRWLFEPATLDGRPVDFMRSWSWSSSFTEGIAAGSLSALTWTTREVRMRSWLGLLIALVTFPSFSQSAQNPAPGFSNGVCTESPRVRARPPDDPGGSSFASPGATCTSMTHTRSGRGGGARPTAAAIRCSGCGRDRR